MYDFLIYNKLFLSTCTEAASSSYLGPVTSCFSYLLTNAWSPFSKRPSSYARVALNILLLLVEDRKSFEMLCATEAKVHVCRQVCSNFWVVRLPELYRDDHSFPLALVPDPSFAPSWIVPSYSFDTTFIRIWIHGLTRECALHLLYIHDTNRREGPA